MHKGITARFTNTVNYTDEWYREVSGQTVTVTRKLSEPNEADYEVGPMYEFVAADNVTGAAFPDELDFSA